MSFPSTSVNREALVFNVCVIFFFIITATICFESTTDDETTMDETTTIPYETDVTEVFLANETENSLNVSGENSTDYLLNVTFDSTLTQEPQLTSSRVINFDGGSVCNCDLVGGVCEVNCCCDEDCSGEDFKVFTACLPQGLPGDDKYCYQENVFYKNNTVYKGVTESSNQLFCIVRDNLKKRMKFKDVPAYSTLESFNKLALKRQFVWNSSSGNILETSNITKAGDAVHIIPLGSSSRYTIPWSLPSQCFGHICNCDQPVYYMEDINSLCTKIVQDLEIDCGDNPEFSVSTYSNFCFDEVSESTFETSDASNMSDETTLASTSTQRPNSASLTCVSDKGYPRPMFNTTSKQCQNVLSSAHYDVWHNGTYGIKRVSALYKLVSLSTEEKFLTQTFTINFKWDKENIIEKRSGNPGYRVWYPLIAGKKLDSSTKPVVNRVSGGLTILKSGADGYCSIERRTINFAENVNSGCLIAKTSSCKSLQDNIFVTLLGIVDQTLYVGTFGNPDGSFIDDWVEIFHDGKIYAEYNSEEHVYICDLVLNVQVQIAFAAVGSFINPQYKIVGIVYKYDPPQPVGISVSDKDLLGESFVYVSTSVNFYDVSESAMPVFKSIPVITAKLPRDFFYPFLLSCANCFSVSYLVLVLIIFSLKVHL